MKSNDQRPAAGEQSQGAASQPSATDAPALFAFSARQQALFDEAVAFARATLNNDVIGRDREGQFPEALWRRCAEENIMGLCVPEAYGGRGETISNAVAYMEGLGFGCTDNGLTYGIGSQVWSTIDTVMRFGTTAQKTAYLPKLCAGQSIGAFAMTERHSGSDCFALECEAVREGDAYRINGEKQLITFAPVADFALVFAKTDPDAGRWGISVFLVDADTPGYQRSAMRMKMGLRTIPIGHIALEDCLVPESAMLGQVGSGASIFSSAQEAERGCILATQIGAMQRQLNTAIAYARDRKQFGQPIGKFQSVSNRIVDMKLRVETCRLLLYKTAHLQTTGAPAMMESALTNLAVAEAGLQSSIDAVRIHGGRGFLTEFEIERDMRDAMGAPLYGGTSDIQRDIIARLLGV